MRVSHVIHSLTGLSKNSRIAASISAEKRVLLANEIRKAEKFNFGMIPAELNAETREYVPPSLSEVEKEAFVLGLLPLPAPSCWYETMVGPKIWAGMLVQASQPVGHIVTPFVSGESPSREIVWGGEHAHVFPEGDDDLRIVVKDIDDHFHNLMSASARFEEMASVQQADETYEAIDRPNSGWYLCNLEAACFMSIYLTLMINSKTTVVQRVGPLKGNRHRAGKSRLLSHHVVTIVPREFVKHEPGDGTHASPRLHWRRSHIRHFDHATPNSKFLAEHEHLGKKGWWLAVIPRFLVGKRELGEVTHDYFVKQETRP